jgi:hypothetical protein
LKFLQLDEMGLSARRWAMPKRIRKPKLDTVQNARRVVMASIGDTEAPVPQPRSIVSQVMAEMGRRGGLIGGKRRLETLSDRRRSQIAKQAAQARWGKKKKKSAA